MLATEIPFEIDAQMTTINVPEPEWAEQNESLPLCTPRKFRVYFTGIHVLCQEYASLNHLTFLKFKIENYRVPCPMLLNPKS